MNSRIPYLYGFNAYRLEATTDLDHNLLIIQEIDKNHGMKFIKYKLTDIINKLYNTYFDHNRAISPFETFGVDIHQFKPLDTFSIPGNMNIVESFQGFAYDGVYNRIILSSQFGPDKLKLDQDKTLFIPKYDTQRMIYVIPWNIPEYRYWTRIPLTNFQGITIKSLINDQLNDNLKPITFATELESNIIVNSTFVYQLIVYHYSDHDMVAQDNLNDIIKISWNEFS